MPLLGTARLSPWTLVLPGRYETFSTKSSPSAPNHFILTHFEQNSTGESWAASQVRRRSPAGRVRPKRLGGLADTTYGVFMIQQEPPRRLWEVTETVHIPAVEED